MPNYSVTIRLPGHSRSQISSKLRAAFGNALAQEAQIVNIRTPPDYYEACQANNHFGCVHWTDEDINSKLRDLKIPQTLQIVDAAKNSYALRHIGDRMVEFGWEVIEEAILEAARSKGQIRIG
jgi:hypothetical protein